MRVSARGVAEFVHNIYVALDGIDVSSIAFAADDVEGWVDCYVYVGGKPVIVDGDIARERRTGDVRIELKPDSPEWAKAQYDWLRSKDKKTQ